MVQGSFNPDNSDFISLTSPQNISLVIMAGGLGHRFGGNKQLALVPGVGKTILELSISDAYQTGIRHIVLVVNLDIKQAVEQQILPRLESDLTVDIAIQAIDNVPDVFSEIANKRNKPWGTGHALLCAKQYVKQHFVVITADDYYGQSAFETLLNNWQNDLSWRLLGYPLKATLSEQGGVNRGICELVNDKLSKITEVLNITPDLIGYTVDNNKVVLNDGNYASMTIWALSTTIFKRLEKGFFEFLENYDSAVEGEFFLPDQIQYLIAYQKQVVELLPAKDLWLGVTYSDDLQKVAQQLKN